MVSAFTLVLGTVVQREVLLRYSMGLRLIACAVNAAPARLTERFSETACAVRRWETYCPPTWHGACVSFRLAWRLSVSLFAPLADGLLCTLLVRRVSPRLAVILHNAILMPNSHTCQATHVRRKKPNWQANCILHHSCQVF